MTSVVRELEWPASRAISSTGTPEADSRLTKLVRSSRGVQSSPTPGGLADGPEGPADVGRIQLGTDRGGEDQVVLTPEPPDSYLLLLLSHAVLPQRFSDRLR